MNYLANLWGRQFRARGVASSLSMALLGLCMAGLALPASAQTPTAADVDRMLAEFDVQHQRTLALIEEAKAAVKPASAFAHLPPDAVPLEAYLGKLFVSVESGFAMKVSGSEEGTLRVVFVNIDATPVGGFQLGARQSVATETYTLYDIQQIAFGDCPANGQPRTANLNRDGSGVGFGWSCGGDRRGRGRQYHSYSLEPEGLGIKTKFVTTTDQGVSNSNEHLYLPMTDELLAAAAARLKQRHEEEQQRQAAIRLQQAEQERERRRVSQERVRSFNRAMEGISGVLNDAVAEVGTYDEAQANLDATVANIQYAADVERQQQALAQQQEQARAAEANRQQLAENARWVAEKEQVAAEYRDGETQAAEARKTQLALKQQEDGQRRTAAEADRRKAQQDALREQGGVRAQATASGSLVLESVVNPSRRESTPPNSTADRQMLVACFLVHHGEFDQGKGVVFFSSTVPVAMEKGRAVGDPTGTFRRKVKSSYNIDGGTACQTLADAAGLQSFMQEVGTSYRRYRKIDTGLSPLE